MKEDELEIRLLRPEETDMAAGLIGRAFRNLPTCIAVFGHDEFWRAKFLYEIYRRFLRTWPEPPLSAWRAGELIGVCGVQHPGNCRTTLRQKLRMTPFWVRSMQPRIMMRSIKVFDKRDAHDADYPHLHIEPLAVEPVVKSDFVGLLLLQAAGDEADRLNLPVFGFTETPQNAAFYESLGGRLVEEYDNSGVPYWTFRREPYADMQPPSSSALARPEGASQGAELGGAGPQ